jgi:iron only hydrogenase large subunit-like protein
MYSSQPIYTAVNDCQDCYKCVRWCPVKSIKVEKDSASIINQDCLYCGRCTLICPAEAKRIRDDLPKAQLLLQDHKRVIASIAPSYIAEFPGIEIAQMIAALKQLGFAEVSETAIGAEWVSNVCRKLIEQGGQMVYISSACPSVVKLITKYYPHLTKYITPVLSPLLAHGTFLHASDAENVKTIFIGPCVAKKIESDENQELIDVALTFKDLRRWFDEEGIDLQSIRANESNTVFPFKAADASMYPVDGGMINSIRQGTGVTDYAFMSFSGIGNIKKVLQGIESWKPEKPMFLELLACEGGCINGPGITHDESLAIRRFNVIKKPESRQIDEKVWPKISIQKKYEVSPTIAKLYYSETEILQALQQVGKLTVKDELNCGGCGYNSCRDFAIAFIEKKAEQNMCVSYMRKVAHNKATAILQKMPSGVIMVDENLKVIEANRSFAAMMGGDMEMVYDANPGLAGADLRKLVSCHKLFAAIMESGGKALEKDIYEGGKLYHVSIFSIQEHHIVCGLFRDMFAPEVRKDEVIRRTRKVIKENLATVQQIAFLLGENASKTEAMLNSIVESHNMGYDLEDETDE